VLPLNKALMKEFARIRGQLINGLDLLIAATALYHDLPTHNLRHFSRIPFLKLYQ
jgi:predicted nucleic acid-binding protein